MARKAYTGLAYLFLLGVLVQVFLAGLGVWGNWHVGEDSDLDPHRALGNVLILVAIVLFVLALAGRLGRTVWALSLFLAIIVALQSAWVNIDGRWVHAVHPAMAIVIFALAHYLARIARP